MTDLRQAAQQALEALLLPTMKTQQMLIQRDEAIIALRRALAEPEKSFEDEQRVINADNHRHADALAEPVAWMFTPNNELLWPHEVEAKTPIELNSYQPLYTRRGHED